MINILKTLFGRYGFDGFMLRLRKRLSRICTAILLIMLTTSIVFGQKIKFERLSIDYGLIVVSCIVQDSKGFMWFGAEDGLYKYDGYRFVKHEYDPDNPNSLSENTVTSLCEDKSGNLWIGTQGEGLSKLNLVTEEITHYKNVPQNPKSLSNNSVWALYMGKSGQLWVGTDSGLDKFNPETTQFDHFTPASFPDQNQNGYKVYCIAPGKKNVLWIGTAKAGFFKFDMMSKQFTHYAIPNGANNKMSEPWVYSLLEDSQTDMVWVGTLNGMYTFDTETEQFTDYLQKLNIRSDLNRIAVQKILMDGYGSLWIGTAYNGLYKIDRDRKKIKVYTSDPDWPDNPESPGHYDITTIYEDNAGMIWIAFQGSSVVNKFDPKAKKFDHYHYEKDNPNSLNDNQVWQMYQDNSGILWIGTEIGGLNRYDPSSGQFTHYKLDSQLETITGIAECNPNILWVGAWGGGLSKFDKRTGRVTRLKHDVMNPFSMSDGYIRNIYRDPDGTLWIGTESSGLDRFDPESGKVINYRYDPDDPNSISHNIIQPIFRDRMSTLWIGTLGGGLNKFDRKTEKFTRFMHDPGNSQSISSNTVISICQPSDTSQNILWIGTSNGLNKFDLENERFSYYGYESGLPGNRVVGILEDDHGNLWISHNAGISKFNPETEQFRNYDKSILGGNDFNPPHFKGKDGRMFFAASHGINAFYPDSIKDNPHVPRVVLTDFQIFNKSIHPGKNSPLGVVISETNKLTLNFDQSVFSFEFAALDYHNPQKNQYAYKMEGVDPDWVHTDASRRFATYTNLDPGDYVFRVKGSNNDEIWNKEGTSIKIIILPPWWRTDWAYTVYALFILSLVLGVWRFQTNRLKMRQEMEMEHFEAEKLREVDQMKSRFFANISHEFRTPLTLIQGPVKEMLKDEFNEKRKWHYQTILRYSDRLLNLINQILDLSKLESGRMVLRASTTNITQYLKGIVQSFASLAERKKVTLKFKTNEKSIIGFVDKDKVEKIVTNLMSNAFKFTPEGGEVIVGVDIPPSPPSKGGTPESPFAKGGHRGILISIFNSGAGIPPDQLDKIFDRFYQADESYTKDSEGSGIGLALTKELVEAHHGEIGVESELNKGTTFTVWLPIEKEHFKPEEIVDIPLSPPSKGEIEITPRRVESSTLEGGARRAGDVSTETPIDEAVDKPKISKSAPLLLIVEDNPDVTIYISSFLEKDYRIITAENGKAGLKKALNKFPDLIISDVMMPVMDGFQFCSRLKSDQRTSHIPLILLTARADMESKLEGLEFGADDYVTKPFDAKELSVRSKNLLEQRRRLQEHFERKVEFQPSEITVNSMDEKFMQRAIELIEQHMDDTDFSAEKFSREIGMSRRHLNRKLHAITNYPARDFIRTIRLKRAAQLLQKNSDPVTQIAYQVGFSNPSYFTECFKNQFGMSPTEYASRHS